MDDFLKIHYCQNTSAKEEKIWKDRNVLSEKEYTIFQTEKANYLT